METEIITYPHTQMVTKASLEYKIIYETFQFSLVTFYAYLDLDMINSSCDLNEYLILFRIMCSSDLET